LAVKRIHNLPPHLSYISTLPDITPCSTHVAPLFQFFLTRQHREISRGHPYTGTPNRWVVKNWQFSSNIALEATYC